MTGEILDQEQEDEPQAHIAGVGMFRGVVEAEASGDHARTLAGTFELGDHAGQRFAVGDNETAAATGGVAVAFGSFRPSRVRWNQMRSAAALFDQPDGVVSEATRRRRASVSDSPSAVSISGPPGQAPVGRHRPERRQVRRQGTLLAT